MKRATTATLLFLPLIALPLRAQIRLAADRPIAIAVRPPDNLRATPATTSVLVQWTCPVGASGFEVFATPRGGSQAKVGTLGPECVPGEQVSATSPTRAALPPTIGATIQTTPPLGQSWLHRDLNPGMEMTYVVRALYGAQFADAGPLVARTNPWPAPAGVAATIAGQNATITWQPIAGTSGYQVYLQQQGATEFKQLTQLAANATSYTTPALPPGQTHRLYVQAVNGLPSTQVAVLSGRPFQFRGQAQHNSVAVHFAFGGTEGATRYLLSRAASYTGPWLPLRTFDVATEGHAVVDTAGIPQLQRFYKLAVTYPGGTVESEVTAVTVLVPVGITQLRVKGTPMPANVSFEWVCDLVATEYRIYRALGTGPSTPMLDRRGQPTVMPQASSGPGSHHYSSGQLRWCSASDANAAAGGSYTYRVVATYNDNSTRDATLTVTLAP
jgi:hypothetical protein